MKDTTKFTVKFGVFCLAVWMTPVVLLIVSSVVESSEHDAQLRQLQHEIGALSHPAHSTFLARHGEIGNFGNGDHIDYWAVELRSITGSRGALKSSYANVRVPVPNAADDAFQGVVRGKQPVEWALLPSPLPAHFHLDTSVGHSSNEWNLSRFAGKQGLYIVQVVNSGENNSGEAFLDWRGG